MKNKKWNPITGGNAPQWAHFIMIAFFIVIVYLAHIRNNHFMIGFGSCGILHNMNKLMEKDTGEAN